MYRAYLMRAQVGERAVWSLRSRIEEAPGVTPRRAALLRSLGVATIADLVRDKKLEDISDTGIGGVKEAVASVTGKACSDG